ncbi:nuclear transport factor 2 family protein [Streptomyces sp. NPDC087843]|uniref:nuclear transport factor 2 family protein n=1 Tax=Streptomyces sp. NPDC087843 TaxID=3365804 RepID=UPI003814F288
MRNARELLLAYTSHISDPAAASALFADDGALELPYPESLGIPGGGVGPEAVQDFIANLLEAVPDLGFDTVDIMTDSGDQLFGEWSVERSTVTGRLFTQTYAGHLVAENAKIKLLRESLDPVPAARATLPNGVSDIPA